MQERAADVKDVSSACEPFGGKSAWFAAIDSPVIIVAHEVTPSDTSKWTKFIKGMIDLAVNKSLISCQNFGNSCCWCWWSYKKLRMVK